MLTHSTFCNFTQYHNVSLYQSINEPWILHSLPSFNQYGGLEAVLKEKFLLSSKKIEPLMTVLMNRDNRDVKFAMTKREGYWCRLLSNESWDEWTESKTELGKVIELFADFMENGAPLSSIQKRLDSETIGKAIKQAQKVLDYSQPLRRGECLTNLALGSMMTLSTQNPLPLALATTACLQEHVSAASVQEHLSAASVQEHVSAWGGIREAAAAQASEEAIDESLAKIVKDILVKLPGKYRELSKKYRIHNLVRTFIQYEIKRPSEELADELIEVRIFYWELVYTEYKKKFGEISVFGANAREYQIEQMRNTLKRHGFNENKESALDFLARLQLPKEECECILLY